MHIYFGFQYFSVDASIWQKWRILYFFKNILSDEDMLCKDHELFCGKLEEVSAHFCFQGKLLKITEDYRENVGDGVLFQ